MTNDDEKQEIIIVKRVMNGDDGHHGGAWKIAFADFMTAMMALFLVLWLVNAANEETKKSVASYFNPVKLVDRNRSTKGLEEASGLETKKPNKPGKETEEPASVVKQDLPQQKSQLFLNNPMPVLDRLAERERMRILSSETTPDLTGSATTLIDDAFLDPFAQPVSLAGEDSKGPETEARNAPPADKPKPTQKPLRLGGEQREAVEPVSPEADVEQAEVQSADEKTKDRSEKPDDQAEVSALKEAERDEAQKKLEAEQIAKSIEADLKAAFSNKFEQQNPLAKGVKITTTDDGVLISVTDQLQFSMFEIGSAVPAGQLVLVMEEISRVLSDRPGNLHVFGHTDARPYAGAGYDNWRLSTDRAHSARLMLLRAGMTASRFSRIIGFADTELQDKRAPEAAVNRRIEILLEAS
ncbi:MAG: MotB family protein [Pseudomonadota bacterium]